MSWLTINEEFGYIVLGTHDVEVATQVLYAHLDRPERQRYLWSDWTAEQVVNACGTPYLVWIRQTFATRATAGRSSTPSHMPAAPPELSSGVMGSMLDVPSRQGAPGSGLRVRRWVLPLSHLTPIFTQRVRP